MADTTDFLTQFSDRLADLAEGAGAGVVAVAGGGRVPVSGIHWRPGIIVTAEEALERDDGIEVMTADGKVHEATLAGRDPSTDIAVLRFQSDGAGAATAGTEEDGEQFGVGQRAGTARQEFFAGTFLARPVADGHGIARFDGRGGEVHVVMPICLRRLAACALA